MGKFQLSIISVAISLSINTYASANGIALEVSSDTEIVADNAPQKKQMDSAPLFAAKTNLLTNEHILPIRHTLTDVVLLEPSAVLGDSVFGYLPALNGASVGENAFFINGMNVTNFRNGLGYAQLPFEMLDSVIVENRTHSARYGRYAGSRVDAVTKSGSNEFKAGMSVIYEPEFLRSTPASEPHPDGGYFIDNRADEHMTITGNIWASGAIIQDSLYFYALLTPQQKTHTYKGADPSSMNTDIEWDYKETEDDPFWGAKIDWYITQDHLLEVTAFSDRSDRITTARLHNDKTAEPYQAISEEGGDNWTIKYTGLLSQSTTLNLQFGSAESARTNRNTLDVNPAVYLRYDSDGRYERGGKFHTFLIRQGDDRSDFLRLNVSHQLGNHNISFGLEQERLKARQKTTNSGGVYYLLYVDDVTNPEQEEVRRVRVRYYAAGGIVESENQAFYVEEQWQLSEQLQLTFGIRQDAFVNRAANHEEFLSLSDNWAPRFNVTYNLNTSGSTQVWFNAGRFYMPVSMEANLRLLRVEDYRFLYYDFNGYVDEELQIPVLDGEAWDPFDNYYYEDGFIDADLEPMSSDMLNLGVKHAINDSWLLTFDLNLSHLNTAVEDMAIDAGFNRYLESEFGVPCINCTGLNYYVLGNPGHAVTIKTDPGVLESQYYTVPAEYLGFPKAERTYKAMSLTAERLWDERWFLKASYTWSHLYGNYEGWVSSDQGHQSANVTSQFDLVSLTQGAKGYLPNDRTHQLKVHSAYRLSEHWVLGSSFRFHTGRPISALGYHPTDQFAQYYGAESYSADGEIVPRGSMGRTDNVMQLDLSVSYQLDINGAALLLKADIFNVLNGNSETAVNQMWDDEALTVDSNAPVKSATYGLPTQWQTPRSVRLSVRYEF